VFHMVSEWLSMSTARRIRPLHTFEFDPSTFQRELWDAPPASSDSVGFLGVRAIRVATHRSDNAVFCRDSFTHSCPVRRGFRLTRTPRAFQLEGPPGTLQDLTFPVARTIAPRVPNPSTASRLPEGRRDAPSEPGPLLPRAG
jgi:hypothetical protein